MACRPPRPFSQFFRLTRRGERRVSHMLTRRAGRCSHFRRAARMLLGASENVIGKQRVAVGWSGASWSVVWRLTARGLLVFGILFCIVSRPATGAEPANAK